MWRRGLLFMASLSITVSIGGCQVDNTRFGGPLIVNDPASSYGAGFFVDVGRPYSFSDVLLGNAGPEPIVIDSVSPIDPQGLRMLGTVVGIVPRRDYPSGAPGFPPPSYQFPLTDLAHATIPARVGVSQRPHIVLVIGLEAEHPGITTTTGFFVRYHVTSGNSYVTTISYAVAFCAPSRYWELPANRERCVAPDAARPSHGQ